MNRIKKHLSLLALTVMTTPVLGDLLVRFLSQHVVRQGRLQRTGIDFFFVHRGVR